VDGSADRCSFIKSDGTRCQAHPRTGRPYCFAHDPNSRIERDAARRAGGRQRSKRAAVLATAGDVTFGCVRDVTRLLGETVSQVRRGDLDPKIANAVFYGTSIALRALMPDETDQQIAELRDQLAELKRRREWHGDSNATAGVEGAPTGDARDAVDDDTP